MDKLCQHPTTKNVNVINIFNTICLCGVIIYNHCNKCHVCSKDFDNFQKLRNHYRNAINCSFEDLHVETSINRRRWRLNQRKLKSKKNSERQQLYRNRVHNITLESLPCDFCYSLYLDVFCVPPSLSTKARKLNRSYAGIGHNVEKHNEDNTRATSFTTEKESHFLKPVLARLKRILPSYNCNDKAFIRSLHGLAQIFHVDYKDIHQAGTKEICKEMQNIRNYGMLFAIEEGTHFWVYDMDQKKAVRVDIPVGAMVIFAGNCIHAGCYGPVYNCFNSLICCFQEDPTKRTTILLVTTESTLI